jgi:dimethylamine/trimethylamine dehydrogenase
MIGPLGHGRYGPSHTPVTYSYDPVQARAMDLDDIREFRRWLRDAALRARDAGFDLVYVYYGHDIAMPKDYLTRRRNRRTDDYGGSLENRARLLYGLLEDAKGAIGDTCALALRFATD